MNLETFRKYCLSKKGTSEDFPFDVTTLVFRVGSKIFALTDTEWYPFRFNLKCDPEWAVELRENYESITPAWHMNKKHWNTVEPNGTIDSALIKKMIDHSYDLVYKSLTKSEKIKVDNLK